jgi:hypothetical protein
MPLDTYAFTIGCHGEHDFDLVASVNLIRHLHDCAKQPRNINAFNIVPRQFRIQARCIGDVRDQPVEPLYVMLDYFQQAIARRFGLCDWQRFEGAAQRSEGVF